MSTHIHETTTVSCVDRLPARRRIGKIGVCWMQGQLWRRSSKARGERESRTKKMAGNVGNGERQREEKREESGARNEGLW